MIYRILNAPPGYPDDQKYLVVAYENLNYDSRVMNVEGRRFVASLDEARQMIPKDANRLPFEPINQFLELYSYDESNHR